MSNLSDNHSSSLDSSKSSNSSNSTGKSAVSINDGLLKERIEKSKFVTYVVKADPHLTQSEKSFKIAQIKRSSKRVESHLRMTHREKVEQFNQKLSKLTERKLELI